MCLESYINLFQCLGITKLLLLCSIFIKLPSFNLYKFYKVIFGSVSELMFADILCIFQVENQVNLIRKAVCISIQICSLLLYECAI